MAGRGHISNPAGVLANLLEEEIYGRGSVEDRCRRLTIRAETGELVPFLWRAVQRYYWEQRADYRRLLLLKYRQGGFTTLEMADSYETATGQPGAQQQFIADTYDKAKSIFRIAERLHTFDPRAPRLKNPGKTTKLELANGSIILVSAAGGRAPARGETLTKVHGSEVPYWPGDFDDRARLVAGLNEATKHGRLVLEGTPNGHDSWFHPTWCDDPSWHKVFLPWFADPLNRDPVLCDPDEILSTLDDEERALVESPGLDLSQLAWRRRKKAELGYLFLQEYPETPESAFVASGMCYFRLEALHEAQHRAPAPVRLDGDWEVFEEPAPGVAYVIGGDVAEGLEGGDWCAASVRRGDDGRQVASYLAHSTPEQFAHELARFGLLYNVALIAPEVNSIGRATLTTLVDTLQYPNVLMAQEWDGRRWAVSGKMGWRTTAVNRPVMLREFKESFEAGHWPICSKRQLAEMETMCVRGSRVEGKPHDDLTFADMIALQAWKQWQLLRGSILVG